MVDPEEEKHCHAQHGHDDSHHLISVIVRVIVDTWMRERSW